MGNSAKANRFNVKKIVYAVISKDDSTGYTHGPIKPFGAPMQVQYTPSYASGPLYGGGVKTEDISKLTGGVLKIDVNKIPIEVRAEILGHTYSEGVLKENKDDQAKDIAIGYELEETGGHRELVWFLKCKAKPFGNNVQQSADNINYSTDSIDIGVMAREFDGNFKNSGDTANGDFTAEKASVFLSTIPGGELVEAA